MTASSLTSSWLREYRPYSGVLMIDIVCAAVLADSLDEADESFRCLIECGCYYAGAGAECLYDISESNLEDYEQPKIAKAVRYLEARGLIERGSEAHLVRFKA